jgi:RNA polymerase subunit RPABC4/transcription elongation factor Spt4
MSEDRPPESPEPAACPFCKAPLPETQDICPACGKHTLVTRTRDAVARIRRSKKRMAKTKETRPHALAAIYAFRACCCLIQALNGHGGRDACACDECTQARGCLYMIKSAAVDIECSICGNKQIRRIGQCAHRMEARSAVMTSEDVCRFLSPAAVAANITSEN